MATEESIQLESFELTVGDLADVDVEKLHLLSMSVGWPHRPKDWDMLREVGQGIAAMDQIGRVLGSAMWFPFGDDFATVGMVITSPRLQTRGTGRWLMDRILQQTGPRPLGLNSTRAARRLYLSMGFTPEATVYQCQGEALPSSPPATLTATSLREAEFKDLPELAVLDRQACNADRSALLARLFEASKGMVLVRGDRIVAFSLCRPFGRGSLVGPVIASNDADAIAVTYPHVVNHAGGFLRLDTRQASGAFSEFLTRSGLPVYDTVTTMSLREPWLIREKDSTSVPPVIYGLMSQTLG
ncbi:GNAT family N-acetyltransferase [Phyllobacterium myrsinacearum]|uniref:GNAT superfamily N-acetyltransferase n=1 Tax=Phyllobacterium myrsinacearum TaxID=28101 RepID=A0A839ESK8_9HYPH|nr:GNAT family N-acetyltransferase [Phyllobacterium myrsinacearum]MBA8879590.1 GNAT superfamily N-acetyltransferase [Phyllobacterium myrsinacearum]